MERPHATFAHSLSSAALKMPHFLSKKKSDLHGPPASDRGSGTGGATRQEREMLSAYP